MITEKEFWNNKDFSWDNINEYKTLFREYHLMYEAIMQNYQKEKGLGSSFTITKISHPLYYEINDRWDYIRKTIDAPILSNVDIEIGSTYEMNGAAVIINGIKTSSIGDGEVMVAYSRGLGNNSCRVEDLGELLISKNSPRVIPEKEKLVFTMSEYDIERLVNKHEALVAGKYRNSQVECRFTSFGHQAAVNAIKEAIEMTHKFIEKK